jgi:hypothetical protein
MALGRGNFNVMKSFGRVSRGGSFMLLDCRLFEYGEYESAARAAHSGSRLGEVLRVVLHPFLGRGAVCCMLGLNSFTKVNVQPACLLRPICASDVSGVFCVMNMIRTLDGIFCRTLVQRAQLRELTSCTGNEIEVATERPL